MFLKPSGDDSRQLLSTSFSVAERKMLPLFKINAFPLPLTYGSVNWPKPEAPWRSLPPFDFESDPLPHATHQLPLACTC